MKPIIWKVTLCHFSTGYNYAESLGSDYFTENFQLKENKTRMRNIHPRFFHLLF